MTKGVIVNCQKNETHCNSEPYLEASQTPAMVLFCEYI